MTDHALTIIKQADLALLAEGGLITPEAAQQLTVAAASIPAMRKVSTPVGQRHFGRIDSMLAVQSPSPVDQARDVLSAIDTLWSGAAGDFHRLREMAFDIKLRQAKLRVAQKKAALIDDTDERVIAEAEVQLEQARVDRLQAQFAADQDTLRGTIISATEQSERYARLCQQAGVESFAEADFLRDEVAYLIKTAFWHAAQTFRLIDARSKDMIKGGVRAREAMQLKSPPEVVAYFDALGISKQELSRELQALEKHMWAFNQFHADFPGGSPSFFDERFGEWLTNMVAAYQGPVIARIKDLGPERLKRIQQIVAPTSEDKGTAAEKPMDRNSAFT